MQPCPVPTPSPTLAGCLADLRREVDERWPHRDRSSDGWIGDAAHSRRVSDHNPDQYGVVHALDLTAAGIQPWTVVLAAVMHPATTYVIFRGRIWSRSHAFYVRHYDGPDNHARHVHVSVSADRRLQNSRRPWLHG